MMHVRHPEHPSHRPARDPRLRGRGTTGMLPTFVIGLREGVEAALIVGIIAAFLIQRGERKAIRSMWLGVAIAIALCVGVAAVLSIDRREPPLQAAGDHGGRAGPHRRGRRHLHDRLDAPPLPRAQGGPRGERRRRAGGRLIPGPDRHGVLRRDPGGAGDGHLHARGVPELQRPDGDRPRRRDRRGGGRGPRLRDLQGRGAHQPQPVLPDHRVRPGAGGRRPAGQRRALARRRRAW